MIDGCYGPQSIICMYCKKEFGGDIYLDSVVNDLCVSLVWCPHCENLFFHIYVAERDKIILKSINGFQNKLLNLILRLKLKLFKTKGV